jgi:hypothetical protein
MTPDDLAALRIVGKIRKRRAAVYDLFIRALADEHPFEEIRERDCLAFLVVFDRDGGRLCRERGDVRKRRVLRIVDDVRRECASRKVEGAGSEDAGRIVASLL